MNKVPISKFCGIAFLIGALCSSIPLDGTSHGITKYSGYHTLAAHSVTTLAFFLYPQDHYGVNIFIQIVMGINIIIDSSWLYYFTSIILGSSLLYNGMYFDI